MSKAERRLRKQQERAKQEKSRKAKTRHGVYQDQCLICGEICDATNIESWVEMWFDKHKKRRIRACKKHTGIMEEFKRQEEEHKDV